MLNFNLYLITDRHQTNGRLLTEVVKAALQGGVKAVQLREKDLRSKDLFELARRMRNLTKQYGARLFINDRLDIALAMEADGVHLGQKSFSAKHVREIMHHASLSPQALSGERFLIGVSVHSLDEARTAETEGADFITFGPIFNTPSKIDYGEPLGVKTLTEVKAKIKIPVFAIGGIKKDNIRDLIKTGADGAAVISAVMGAEDVRKAVREINSEFK